MTPKVAPTRGAIARVFFVLSALQLARMRPTPSFDHVSNEPIYDLDAMPPRVDQPLGGRSVPRLRARAAVAWRFMRHDLQRWPFELVVNVILASPLVPRVIRSGVLRALGMQLETYEMYPHCTFRSNKLRVGKDTVINSWCHFDNDAPIEIGAGAGVAMRVTFVTSTHKIGPPSLRASELELKPIVVGDGCWIGAGAMILPGVTIGEGCIIGAAAVVTGDCAPNGIYLGVPARRVGDLPNGDLAETALGVHRDPQDHAAAVRKI